MSLSRRFPWFLLALALVLPALGCASGSRGGDDDETAVGGAGQGGKAGDGDSSDGAGGQGGVSGDPADEPPAGGDGGGVAEGGAGGSADDQAGAGGTGGSPPASGGRGGSQPPAARDGCDSPPEDAADPKLAGLCYKKAWDGSSGTPWLVPEQVARSKTFTTELLLLEGVHSPPLAQKFTVSSTSIIEFGIQSFDPVKNLGEAKYFVMWVKFQGQSSLLRVDWGGGNDACGRLGYAWPDRLGVKLGNYNPKWNNGEWQQIIIPASDIHQNKPACLTASNIALRVDGGIQQNYSVTIDDIGFYFENQPPPNAR